MSNIVPISDHDTSILLHALKVYLNALANRRIELEKVGDFKKVGELDHEGLVLSGIVCQIEASSPQTEFLSQLACLN